MFFVFFLFLLVFCGCSGTYCKATRRHFVLRLSASQLSRSLLCNVTLQRLEAALAVATDDREMATLRRAHELLVQRSADGDKARRRALMAREEAVMEAAELRSRVKQSAAQVGSITSRLRLPSISCIVLPLPLLPNAHALFGRRRR
jgi:hypothetical protein